MILLDTSKLLTFEHNLATSSYNYPALPIAVVVFE